MGKYILDTNIIISLWKQDRGIKSFIEDNDILILREVLEELSKKERKRFNGAEIMSERFMKLVPFMYESNKFSFEEFLSDINFENIKGKSYYYQGNKLTEIDLLLVFATKCNGEFQLVTEDLGLFDFAKNILGDNKVLRLGSVLSELL